MFALSLLTLALALPAALAQEPLLSDIDAYLKGHNDERAKHGANPLKWNGNLAAKAQQWANGCVFQHSGGSLGPYGENLAAGAPASSYPISSAIALWNAEEPDYNPSNPQYSHWTQVVWKSTTDVGCAVAHCGNIFPGFPDAAFYVCEYSPAGNVIGQFP
ncbi:PR-1-like protein [Auricularia subglabra TFB-10046 SS5]|nr:PR-1-like protein [Auricularia subglabra TFB-10046 SS5]